MKKKINGLAAILIGVALATGIASIAIGASASSEEYAYHSEASNYIAEEMGKAQHEQNLFSAGNKIAAARYRYEAKARAKTNAAKGLAGVAVIAGILAGVVIYKSSKSE